MFDAAGMVTLPLDGCGLIHASLGLSGDLVRNVNVIEIS
jgi:hypothetical protein